MQLPPIETARLLLRPLAPGDAAALRAITDDPAITGVIQFLKSPFTLSDALDLIEHRPPGVDRLFGIRRSTNGELVGVTGAGFTEDGEIEIGYWIGTAFQRSGYAQEAAGALVEALARAFPGRAIVAACRKDNRVSWHILEKLGFTPTGEASHRPGRERLVRS